MNLSELNPHIRYARIHKVHYNNVNEYSICYDCRLFFAKKAEGHIIADNKKYNISIGTAIYLPPLTKYKLNFIETQNFEFIVLDFDLVNDFSHLKSGLGTATAKKFSKEKVLSYPLPDLLKNPIVKPIPQLLQPLTQCTKNFLICDRFYRERSSAILKLCLLEFIRESQRNETYSALCEKVIGYICENYSDSNLSNKAVADEFGYHPYHLSRILKQETGKSLRQYLIDYRLQMAKNLLLTTSDDVEQIAWKTGFSSTAYFVKLFHMRTGTTPKKYRRFKFHTEL